MATMSIDTQIQKMQEMRGTLEQFCKLINSTMDSVNDNLNRLVMQGFPIEFAQRYYSQYYMSASQQVDSIVREINTKHYEYIDNIVSDLTKTL